MSFSILPAAAALCALLCHTLARAEPLFLPADSPVQLSTELTAWISEGELRWSHDASSVDPLRGNPTSELTYKDVGTTILELDGRARFANGWLIRMAFGYGAVGGGRVLDDDFVSADGAAAFGTSINGPHRASRTQSDLSGEGVWFVTADVGRHVVSFDRNKGSLAVFAGAQYWREKHVARGLTQLECTAPGTALCDPAGTVSAEGQKVITNMASWLSIRIGLEGSYAVTRRLTLGLEAAVLPYARLRNDDVHHLRTDLRQDPSFSMTGRGFGVNAEITGKYQILTRLYLQVGYRLWWLHVVEGRWQNHPRVGQPVFANLNEFTSQRDGLTVGILYIF